MCGSGLFLLCRRSSIHSRHDSVLPTQTAQRKAREVLPKSVSGASGELYWDNGKENGNLRFRVT